MSPSEMRRLRLRFLLIPLVVVCCVLATNLRVRSVGTTYDYRADEFKGMKIAPEQVSFEPAGMATCEGVSYDEEGTPVLHLVAQGEGEGIGQITLENFGGTFQVAVRPGNMLIVDAVNFTGWEWVAISVMVCLGVAAAINGLAVASMVRKAWYGYEMSAYLGLSLFCLYQMVNVLNALCSHEVRNFSSFAIKFIGLADNFLQSAIVPLVLVAALVCLSNVALVRREGMSPHNLLGVFASIAMLVAYFVWSRIDPLSADSVELFLALTVVNMLIGVGISFAIALLEGSSICAWAATRHVPSFPRDYLLILGCGIRPDGTLTPLLAGRADAALVYAREQEAQGHHAPTFVPSGGQGADEVCSEAEAIAGYLEQRGVPVERILREDRSTSTRENFARSAELIRQQVGEGAPRVGFATTNYHVFRGYIYAHDAGLAAEGIAAPTKLYFWPNAFLREFVGLVVSRIVPIAITYLMFSLLYCLCAYIMILS